jgi:N-acetylglucosamine-6-phosphate deacetylase
MDYIIAAQRLYTPLQAVERPLVFIADGWIAKVSRRDEEQIPAGAKVVELEDSILVPGFIDMHIHGGGGHDVMEPAAEALPAVEKLLFRHGVTSYFPTTVTASVDLTLAALERLAGAIEQSEQVRREFSGRARPLGIHLEGPFISHKRPGVHPLKDLLPPTLEMFEKFWQAARGHIKVLTIAPELEGAKEVITEAARRGVCVSMGHSDADTKAAQAGIAAGARHATHTFNAMRPLDHREPGILGEALADGRLTAEIIADGVHVDPLVVKLFLRAKGSDASVLVTDATAATGMPNGKYRLGSLEVDVMDGKCTSNGKLAGSVLTLDQAIRNVMKFAKWDLQQAVRLATVNPARAVGLPANMGTIHPGAAADMVALGTNGEVRRTIAQGRLE